MRCSILFYLIRDYLGNFLRFRGILGGGKSPFITPPTGYATDVRYDYYHSLLCNLFMPK